jgi:hypothetical protein
MNLSYNMIQFDGYSDCDCTNDSRDHWQIDTSVTRWTVGMRWNMAPGLCVRVEYAKTNYDFE